MRIRLNSRKLDLQAKISLVLVGVLLPTYLVITIVENKFTQPLLEEEIRLIGVTSAKNFAAEIVARRLLSLPNPTPVIESHIQETLYSQPNIVRMDVLAKDPITGAAKLIASNIEEDEPTTAQLPFGLVDTVTGEYKVDDTGVNVWEISVPIEQRPRDPKSPKKLLGSVHVVVTTRLVNHILTTLWKITATAAGVSVGILYLALSYFLRKTIANDRRLRKAETQNLQLTEQLHDAHRQLMNTEKLAVMGQLTASFAHEIGTPLNAIGGHLQLLKEELPHEVEEGGVSVGGQVSERLEVINSQLHRIEQIVKNFLQSTAKPVSQRQLVDLNRIVDQTIGIVRPRVESMRVEVKRDFDRKMGPVRVVPLDLEQILLNLVNNSLDSIQAKTESRDRGRMHLDVITQVELIGGNPWAVVSVYDTGEGIRKVDLANVLKPFFTTKRPGEGTGLGLTICQQLARKYGGMLEIDSKEGAWTRVTFKLPYQHEPVQA